VGPAAAAAVRKNSRLVIGIRASIANVTSPRLQAQVTDPLPINVARRLAVSR
jgi:hypothetical protein